MPKRTDIRYIIQKKNKKKLQTITEAYMSAKLQILSNTRVV